VLLKSPPRLRREPRLPEGEVIDAFWLRPPPAIGGFIEPLSSAISESFLEEAVEPELPLPILANLFCTNEVGPAKALAIASPVFLNIL